MFYPLIGLGFAFLLILGGAAIAALTTRYRKWWVDWLFNRPGGWRKVRAALYSGPGRSGTCVCGHKWDAHHLGIVMNPDMLQVKGGGYEGYVPQECEFYGCNEDGGLDRDGNEHCFGYRDSLSTDVPD